jgi:PAS domain S-box-containing protein
VSPQIEAAIGFTPEEYAANPDTWRQRLHPDDRDRVLADVARCQASGGPLVSEYRMVARDGRVVWFRDQAAIVRDAAGRPLVLQGVMLDITERRRLEREVLEISDAERRRIGQELHDGLGQEVLGIRFLCGALVQELTKAQAPGAEPARTLHRLLDDAVEHTRALARGACPLELACGDLAPALHELAEWATDTLGVACTLDCPETLAVEDDATATHLYHIAREALTNAARHGEATRVTIALAADGDALTLSVEDDGAGVPEPPRAVKGLGLRIMRYRADVMGATLTVLRGADGGTLVACCVPLGTQEDAMPHA